MKKSDLIQIIKEEIENVFNEMEQPEQIDEAVIQKVLEKLGLSDKLEKAKAVLVQATTKFEKSVIDQYEKMKADPRFSKQVELLDKAALAFKGTSVNQTLDKLLNSLNPQAIPTDQIDEGVWDVAKNILGKAVQGISVVGAASGVLFPLVAFLYNPLYQVLMPVLGAGGIAGVSVGLIAIAIILNTIGKHISGEV